MDPFREFRAKTVDEAIHLACQAFAVEREELEIDIISMGSPGFFGLGAKKATILARLRPPVTIDATMDDVSPNEETTAEKRDDIPSALSDEDDSEEDIPDAALSPLPPEAMEHLTSLVHRFLLPLTTPLCGQAPTLRIQQEPDGIIVRIEDEQHQGLLIGREGQTILALQYLLNRMLAKAWREAPRVQLDAGDFRSRQIQRLQALAHSLAVRAKRSGRVQATGPLSSFHRRVVHLALRDDTEVRTVSKGTGALKRVLVCPVKGPRRTP